jgi:HSP20 family protein
MPTRFPTPRDWFRNELQNFFRDAARPGSSRSRARRQRTRTAGVFPAVNIYDDGEGYRVRAELPGIDSDDLEINAEGDQLEIRGERTIDPPSEDANWHRREREGEAFRRVVNLPQPINPDEVTARLDVGVLDIFAPRAEQHQPRKIEIE